VVAYRWKADVPGFAMPIRVGKKDGWQTIKPTSEWQEMNTPLSATEFAVDEDHYYVIVSRSSTSGY
jgi:hypothetical protein